MPTLPLFPLPGTVVFPGMTVPLYVFEERYKRLISLCLELEKPRFVIALAKADDVIRDEETPFYRVGTVVHILQVSQNPDGTYNLLGHGQERCLIEVANREDVQDLDGSSRPLFFSEDTTLSLQRGDPNEERLAAWDALETFQKYAKQFFAFQAAQQIEEVMPEDLVYQASFICANIRVPSDSRQVLLEAPSLIARFQLAQKLMLERMSSGEAAKKVN
ncbi:MAG: LON peptidase substrate-binding domain-containing protein [Trueperaceae bacterium]